jgi:hypothetical protein
MDFESDTDLMQHNPRLAIAIVMVVGLLAYLGTTAAFGNEIILVNAAVFALAFGVVYAGAYVVSQRLNLGEKLT